MHVDPAAFGLKSSFRFKEYHVATEFKSDAYLRTIRENVWPTIADLEGRGLINGFHFIRHAHLDVRLSADWGRDGRAIDGVLVTHGIRDALKDWMMPPEEYGGALGLMLCYNQLEFTSRLLAALACATLVDDRVRAAAEGLVTRQWVHYLYVQYGYTNQQHTRKQLNDALAWLEQLRERDPAFVEGVWRQLREVGGTCGRRTGR